MYSRVSGSGAEAGKITNILLLLPPPDKSRAGELRIINVFYAVRNCEIITKQFISNYTIDAQ